MSPDDPAESPKSLRVLLADDHPVVRDAAAMRIATVPGWEVCGLAANGRELVEQARTLRPDVIVLDFHMPEFDGLEGVRELKQLLPDAELVIFSGMRNDALVEKLFDAGAKSFVSKTEGGEVLIAAVRAAAEHEPFLTPKVSEILFARVMGGAPGSGEGRRSQITPREREIIRQIADGRSNKEIGAAFGISSRTAEVHRATILRKLGVSSTAEIVRFAIRNGIVEP